MHGSSRAQHARQIDRRKFGKIVGYQTETMSLKVKLMNKQVDKNKELNAENYTGI